MFVPITTFTAVLLPDCTGSFCEKNSNFPFTGNNDYKDTDNNFSLAPPF